MTWLSAGTHVLVRQLLLTTSVAVVAEKANGLIFVQVWQTIKGP